ncbi:hypothetical protein ATANTOWER_029176 [Ataeniobius toweri]|uniref:Cathepsin propeptide inhibitor domain-containing protein n=1 Tax=Ataeniobius toweri TaxID=208326 RepID=A0ABU7BEN3_9TELE|nr:hypothetical protein [Ataeniobius toweri]
MGKHSYTLGMNHFGDMTNKEFRKMMNGYRPRAEKKAKGSSFMKPNFLNAPCCGLEGGRLRYTCQGPGSVWLLLGLQRHWVYGGTALQKDQKTGVAE